MTGFRVAVKNVRLKSDPDGKVHLVRIHKLPAGQRKNQHAKSSRLEKQWKAAEHYSPINSKEQKP